MRVIPLLALANLLVLAAAAAAGWWMTRQYDALFFAAEKAHAQRLADEAVSADLWRGHLRVVRAAAQEMAQNDSLRQQVESGNAGALRAMLPDVAWRRAVSSGEISYVGISVFDRDMHPLAESWAHQPEALPPTIIAAAAARKGIDALKFFDAVWLSNGVPRLTVIAPVGGLHPVGYLALHVDPLAAAKELDRRLDMEVHVFTTDGRLLLSPGNVRLPPGAHVAESVLKLRGPAGEWLADLHVRADDTGLVSALGGVRLDSLMIFLAAAGGVSALAVIGVAAVLRQMRRREREAAAKIEAQAMREAVLDTEHRLAEQNNRKLEGLSVQLSKYLSPQIYDSIFAGRQTAEITAQRKKLTVFFSDIADFTQTTDSMESEELTSLLNSYLTEMSTIALSHGATIDKYIGDAILVFFGDPESHGAREDALRCVKMAVAMQRRMRELHGEWVQRGIAKPFHLRIGINTGFCTVGNFGSDDRMDYTIIGNEVNLAARLQSSADHGGILIGHETYSLVRDVIPVEEREPITVKGFAGPVANYRVLDIQGDADAAADVVRHQGPGAQIDIDFRRLSSADRSEIAKIIEELGKRLRAAAEPPPHSPIEPDPPSL